MDKEQHNFLFGAASRDPGKRQIKPNAAFFDQLQLIANGTDDDEEDEDVVFPSPNVSRSSTDSEQQKEGEEDEEQSSTNDNDDGEEEEDAETGGNSTDDGHGHREQRMTARKGGKGSGTVVEVDSDADLDNAADGLLPVDQHKLCAVCLGLRPADLCGELIQCDRCALFVHELCYGCVAAWEDAVAGGHPPTEANENCQNTADNAHNQSQQPEMEEEKQHRSADPRKNSQNNALGDAADANGPTSSAASAPAAVVAAASNSSLAPPAATVAPDAQSVASSSASTEPWFCEPCLFGVRDVPHCELCPSRYGAFKRTAAGGGWVHVQCAAFTPGVRFADPASLSAVCWRDIDARAFGRKACAGCCSSEGDGAAAPRQLLARTGVTVKCDAGMCRHFYHVTCAQRLGLLVDLESEAAHQRHHHHNHPPKQHQHTLQNHHHHPQGHSHNRPHHQHHHSSAEVGYLYCERHAPRDASVSRMRNAYATFVRSEERRLAQWNRRVSAALDVRQERKRTAQLRDYRQRIQQLLLLMPTSLVANDGVDDSMETTSTTTAAASGTTTTNKTATTTTVVPTQRRAKMLHTNARLLNAFAEKHELLGLDGAQFAEEFNAVPAAHLPSNLTPAFSKTFISYAEHRDSVGLPGESARLELLRRQLAQRQLNQKEAEHRLDELRKMNTDAQSARSAQQRLLDRCRAVVAKTMPPGDAAGDTNPLPLLLLLSSLPPPLTVADVHGHGIGGTVTAPAPLPASSSSEGPKTSAALFSHSLSSKTTTKTIIDNGSKSANVLVTTGAANNGHRSSGHRHKKLSTVTKRKRPNYTGPPSAAAAAVVAVGGEQFVVPPMTPPPPPQCQKCKKTTDAHLLAYCETCKCHYHIGCLDPPLAKMPAKSKFSRFECSDCACPSETDDDNTDDGKTEAKGGTKKQHQQQQGSTDGVTEFHKKSSDQWVLLQNRPKRQRRSPRKC